MQVEALAELSSTAVGIAVGIGVSVGVGGGPEGWSAVVMVPAPASPTLPQLGYDDTILPSVTPAEPSAAQPNQSM